jgi:hypothetical protein
MSSLPTFSPRSTAPWFQSPFCTSASSTNTRAKPEQPKQPAPPTGCIPYGLRWSEHAELHGRDRDLDDPDSQRPSRSPRYRRRLALQLRGRIDGMFTSNDVLQAGVDQRVAADGAASCFAWYEWSIPNTEPGLPGYISKRRPLTFP